MSEQTDRLLSLLLPYGLTADEASLYLNLWEDGCNSALLLSRRLNLARTKVYRILDKLINLGLVIVKLGDRGKVFEAANVKQLSMLVNQKEFEAQNLKTHLSALEQELEALRRSNRHESKVLFYQGIEGLKQVTWNSLRAKGELSTFEIKDMDAFFDHEYAENLRRKFVERKINIRTLTNAIKIPPWTDVAGAVQLWEIRHIPEKQLKIKFEILIYNDVYVMYRYRGREVFCVETYNQELADMQRQMFEYVWQKAGKFKVLNKQGEARLKLPLEQGSV